MTNTNLQAINHVNKNVALGLVMGQSLDWYSCSMITIKRGVTTQPESIKRGVTKQTQSENLKWLL
jgi:Na+/H+ antiporter NhaA